MNYSNNSIKKGIERLAANRTIPIKRKTKV